MSLSTLLDVYPSLEPSVIKSGLRDIVRHVSSQAQSLTRFVDEIDAAIDQGRLSAYHYSFALRVSQSLSWAVRCFETRHELPIFSAAIVVITFNLKTRTHDALAHFDGVDGLITFVGDKLPFSYAHQLFKELSSSTPSGDMIPIIDGLTAAAFIYHQPGRPKPLERLAPAMILTILGSASASTLRLVLPRVVPVVSVHQWRRLIDRHPDLISEFVLAQVGIEPNQDDWSGHVKLERSSWLAPCINMLLCSGKALAVPFFHKFLRAYTKYTAEHLPPEAQYDVLEQSGNRIAALDLYMRGYFKKYTDSVSKVHEVLSVLSSFKSLNACEGRVGWAWNDVSNTLEVLVDEFSRQPALWDFALEPSAVEDPIITGLRCVFRGLNAGLLSIESIAGSVDLLRRPRGARFPLLYLAFASIGIRLDVLPDASSTDSYPTCSLVVLSSLSPAHCVQFLDIGMRTKGQSFLQDFVSSSSQMARALSRAFRSISSLESSRQHDARLAMIRAACEGARRGPAGDTAADTNSFESVRNDVASYVRLASRSQDDMTRLNFATLALTLCVVSQSPGHFLDTLQAMLGQYAKDPTVGPGIVTFVARECDEFLTGPACLFPGPRAAQICTRKVLQRWLEQSSLILSALLDSVKLWAFNSAGYAKANYDGLGRLISTLFSRRLTLLRLYQPTLISSATDAVSLLLDPLRGVLLAWEKLRVLDQPQMFGFTSRNCVPKRISTAHVEPRHASTVLSYMCSLGEERMQLYEEGRRVFWFRFDGEPGRDSGTYSILPVAFTVTSPASTFYSGFSTPQPLKDYCEDILFLPLVDALSPALSTKNRWYFHTSQFECALTDYLFYSETVSEVIDKIIRLFEHYPEDYAFLILRHPTVSRLVWTQPRLHRYIDLWFPESLWTQNGKTDDSFLDVRAAFVATPLRWFPKRPFVNRKDHVTLLEARHSRISDTEVGKVMLAPFMGLEHFSGFGRVDLPMKMSHRLSALAICWALTSCAPSRDISSRHSGHSGDPVSLALERALIDPTSMSVLKASSSASPFDILPFTLSYLRDDEVSSLVTTLFSIPDSPVAQALAFECLRQLRQHRPHLVYKRLFDILGQSRFSDWQRQVVCLSAMRHLSHGSVLRTIQELQHFVKDRAREERERRESSKTKEVPELDDSKKEPLLKVTTIKMLVDLLGEAMGLGIISADMIPSLRVLEMSMPHASVKTRIVSVLKALVFMEDVLACDRATTAFDTLVSYVEVGSRLSEGRHISDDEWADIAKDGSKEMPDIDAEHPVAVQLITVELKVLTHSLAAKYARSIIEPCVLGQVRNRSKWLRSAMTREGGTLDIHATYDAEFDAPQLYSRSRRYLRNAPRVATAYDGLLGLIHQRAILFLDRTPYQELLRLVKSNHPDDWQTSSYGKTIASLCTVATTDESSAFTAAISALMDATVSEDIPADSYDIVHSALTDIGEHLLLPTNIAAFFQPPPSRSQTPFHPFGSFLKHLDIDETRPGTWTSKIRPIAERLLVVAQTHVAQTKEPSRNAEALYATHIFRLQLLLLPHPGYRPYSADALRHTKWVNDITQLLGNVVAMPNPQKYLSEPFSTFFQGRLSRIPTSDAFELIKLLFARFETNPALQIARIELAIRLSLIYWPAIQSDVSAREQYEAIRQELLSSDDGILRVASFSM